MLSRVELYLGRQINLYQANLNLTLLHINISVIKYHNKPFISFISAGTRKGP